MRIKSLPFRHIKRTVFITILAVVIGCAANKEHIPIPEDVLLTDGKNQIEDEDYKKAEESFKKLLEEYPDSKLRVKAHMGLADSLYNQKKYDEAILQYQHFIEIYPADKNRDKAHFYKGMSYFNQKKTVDRDQSYIQNAYEEFSYIVSQYPESTYFEKALKNIITCKRNLAKNLLHIGKFYYRTGAFHSAINRFKDFLALYPDQVFADEAYFYLGKSYLKKESIQKAVDTLNTLVVKFPDTNYAKKGGGILKTLSSLKNTKHRKRKKDSTIEHR